MNPTGQSRHYILADLITGRWIGGLGFAPNHYLVNNEMRTGVLAVNGFINPGYENQGLYTRLFSFCLQKETAGGRFIFGFTHSKNIASRKGVLKSGWKEYGKMSFLQLDPRTKSQHQGKVIVTDDAGPFNTLNYQTVENHTGFAFRRCYEYFRWRFETRPHKRYIYLTVDPVIGVGYMILGFYTTPLGNKLCQIVDFGWSQETCFVPLVHKACEIAVSESCDILDMLVMNGSGTEKSCLEQHMIRRDEGYDMYYYTADNNALPDLKHVTYADNDVI